MPVHQWSQVSANRFHDFHLSWCVAISKALNHGVLPEGHFALLQNLIPKPRSSGQSDAVTYARKANVVTVRHPDGQVVAVIEIVSPGNKDSKHAVRSFARKAVEFLHAGIHLLIVDLFPPSKRDPQGVHKLIWDRIKDEPFELPPDKPLTLAAYSAGTTLTGYIEPVGVGDHLTDMPIFLTSERYVACPLEATYQECWAVFPKALKGPLENPPVA